MRVFINSKCFLKKLYIIFLILFTVFCGTYNTEVNAEEYIKCHSIIEINGLASSDYIDSKKQTFSIGYPTTSTTDTVSSLNNTYKNFIQIPADVNSGNNNFLFLILKKDNIKNDLSCGFISNDNIFCNSSQLWGSGCVEEYEEEVIVGGNKEIKKTKIETCDLFDKQNDKTANSACYPERHICNTYKNDVTNKYFSIKGDKIPNATNDEKKGFYIYTKNVVAETKGSKEKTCDFEILPCDLKIKNETSGDTFINVVFKNTNNEYNKKFVENISSGFNNDDIFFRYVGTTSKNSDDYNDIMKASYYYKYINANSESEINNNTTIFYYKKYLTGGADPKGRICSGYLPNCIYVDPKEESNLALYNRIGEGNKQNRNTFYNSKVSGISSSAVREEYLWFAANPYSANQVCLSRIGTSNSVNHDVGYCSDLTNDFSKLKYEKGLEYNNDGTPKCYLKSCIDLTVEELNIIKNTDTTGIYKWCSEYYYLESSGGLKHFPKEKPNYCSDLDSSGYLKYRATWEEDGGTYKYCAERKENDDDDCIRYEYYSYGGGRNSTKSNCYLKNCFSLNSSERQEIADANVTNIGFEMEKNTADLTKFNRDNLPKYCDNGFLFNNQMDEFQNFDYLNLNVISCLDFSKEQLDVINAGRMILFTDLLGEYDTTLSKVFCRTHYKPLNKKELVELGIHNEKTNFLETTYIIADESEMISNNSSYLYLLNAKYGVGGYDVGLGNDPFINIPERAKTDYKKIGFSDLKSVGVNKYLFSNVCSYVDNSFLYYNTDVWDLRHDVAISDSNAKIAEVINNIQKRNNTANSYLSCLNDNCNSDGECQSKQYILDDEEAKNRGFEPVPDKCKECNKNIDSLKKNKCLVDTEGCEYYAYDYLCKKNAGCVGDDGTISESLCFLKDDISNYTIDCNQYISKRSITNTFDCSLFINTSNSYIDIYNNYLNYGSDGLNQNDLEEIKKNCNDHLPLTDTRNLPEPDIDSALLKPFKLDTLSFNANASGEVGKYDIERYGCALYGEPTNVTEDLDAGLWGCRIPEIGSSYISKNTSDLIINNIYFKEEFKQPYMSQVIMSVCSRYPENKYINNKCGQREGSSYKDKCLEIVIDNENISNSETLEDTSTGDWYFESATGGSRFRYEKHGRDILIFRDFYTYYKCNASNIDSGYYYYDEVSAGIITGEATALGAIIGAVTGAISCAFLFAIPGFGWAAYAGCVAAVTFTAIGISIASMLLSRTEEYNLSLQNNLYYPHEYFGNNENYGEYGFLSKANITNNDNYVYRYYQRSDNIEEDLKNKLESNIDWNTDNRFYFGNTLSKDIIRKCNIQNLFGIIGNCIDASKSDDIESSEEQISYDQVIHCDYQYVFFELEDDGNRKQENGKDKQCEVEDDGNAEKCLTERQRKCLAGYGVKFLFNIGIDNEFLTSTGGFLKTYQDGDSVKQNWETESIKDNYNWVPVNIVPYTMDVSKKNTLQNRAACKLMKYGDSFGSLDRCRGFEHNGIFYTESQSLKTPLFTSPIFFYTLITPRNVPELFNPTVMLDYYYLFSKYQNGEINNSNKNKYEGLIDKLILDFYNPKVQYYYDFVNGTGNEEYDNKYTEGNQFVVEIEAGEKTGKAHVLRYLSDIFTNEMSYGFTVTKTSIKTLHNSYTPQVCLYQIKAVNTSESGLNSKIETSYCNKDNCKYRSYIINENTGTNDIVSCCLEKTDSQSFIIVDNNVECYERAIPFLSDFVFMQSKNIEYNNPVINVYLKPSYKTINDITSNKDTYMLKSGDSEDILLSGENSIQSFGLNFERSYCSKAYYDYYRYLDLLKKELNNINMDLSKISLYRKNLSTIESIIIPDCKKENGNEIDLLINEDTMKAYNDVNGIINNIIAKETVKVRDNNALYGGFNEVCVTGNDIKHILKTYNKQRSTNITLPNVLVYKSAENTEQRKTKCILDINSMNNVQCMIAEKVYVYCTDEEKNFGNNCEDKLDISNNKLVSVREVDCLAIKNSINSVSSLDFIKSYVDNGGSIKDIQACYKGGFNMMNTVYKNESTQEYSCSCVIANSASNYGDYGDFITEREITSREYGLCVDLIEPSICPAVRYFDSNSQYVDDRLALGKTEDELENMDEKDYQQHLWRTNEKQLGIVPSVFYESSLGHAEFPASVYCGGDKIRYSKNGNNYVENINGEYVEDKNRNKVKAEEYYKNNCVGGTIQVEGECNGYWKENVRSVPIAVCTARTNNIKGTTIYEYKLLNYGCERYQCPAIGYDSNTNAKNLDEKIIEYNDSLLFKENEIKTFSSGVELTDFSSFKHNEELDPNSVDIRGASNGFAVWGEQNTDGSMNVVSSDYAKIVKSQACLTGFAPAGTNYRLLNEFKNESITNYNDYNIYYQTSLSNKNNNNTYMYFKSDSSFKNSLIQIYKDRKTDYDNFIYSLQTPQRRCNQFGEWMTVEDPYNNGLISNTNYGENFYYNSSSNSDFWRNIYLKSNTDFTNEEIVKLGNGNYCERLVCYEVSSNNKNYFKTEFLYNENKADSSSDVVGSKKEYYSFWKHSGGAFWNTIGTPRNSSDMIEESTKSVGYGDSSRSIDNIFSATTATESTVNNKYKYVKKVYGRCENEYGYYNRNSQFNNTNFTSQYNKLVETLYSSIDENGEVDPRKEVMLDNSVEIIKPSRHCTSTGLWSGVLDPCFRACEMMDIYHTTFNNNVYKQQGNNKVNIIGGNEYFIENNDIISIDLKVNNYQIDGKRTKFEERFITLHNPDNLDEYNSLKTGDYLTGGAKWPRSIVKIDNNIKLETSGSKAGLRYIEVEADCDSSFDTGDNRIRQFILRSTDKRPKRKCYEDGTWGSVYEDTRCILAKNCVDFSFTLFNLTNLMAMYNRSYSALAINSYIANIPYGGNGIFNNGGNDSNMQTPIYNFLANNTAIGSNKSYNIIETNDSSKYLTAIENGTDLSDCDTTINANCIGSSICTITESNESTNMAGWSLNLKGSDGNINTNIGRYFKPTTCNINSSSDNFYVDSANNLALSNINELNRIQLVYTPSGNYVNKLHYSKDSLLNYSYNLLNSGMPSNCDYRYSNNTNYNKTEIENESCKGVNIGTDYYNSYQIHYECKDNYYNKLNVNGDSNYYNKHIIFECETRDTSKGKFYYNINTQNNTNGDKEVIRALDCEPITCGEGDGQSNKYQKGWSKSIITELIGNNAGISVESKSILKCPEGKAFIFKNNPTQNQDGGQVKYYKDRNGVDYSQYAFVSEIHGTCSKIKSKDGEINGSTVDESSYDYRRYGEIKLGALLETELCTDIYKKNCHKITNENDIFAKGNNFKNTYCIPMACPYKGLEFKDSTDGDTVTENSSGFSLPGSTDDRYEFGTNVVIQSIDGDYKNGRTKEYCENWYDVYRDEENEDCKTKQTLWQGGTVVDHWDLYGAFVSDSCVYTVEHKKTGDSCNYSEDSKIDSSITIDNSNIFYNYSVEGSDATKQITGNICSDDTDIYSEGGPIKYGLYDYLSTISDSSKKIEINSCFSMLNDNEVTKYSNGCQNGYSSINNKVCVKYSDNYLKSNKDYLNSLKTKISNFTTTNAHKNNAVNFIVDTIMFNGTNVNKNNDYINNTYTKIFEKQNNIWKEVDTEINKTLTSEANNLLDTAKQKAVVYTNNYINTTDGFVYKTCKHEVEDWYNNFISDNIVSVVYNGSLNTLNNNLMQQYKEITGISDDFYEFTDGENNVIVGILTNNNIDSCKQSRTKYKISSLVNGYYKIKKEEPLCVDESKLVNNQIEISGEIYKKMDTSESCTTTDGINGVKVEKLDPIGTCFYNSTGELASSAELNTTDAIIDCGTETDCADIISKQLNSGVNILIPNVDDGDIVVNGETWTSSDKETCESGYYFIKEEFIIEGKGFISLEDYINIYNNDFIKEVDILKGSLKTDIISKTAGSTNEAKEAYINLFDKWVEKYKTEEFLEKENNEDLYNTYLSIYQEKTNIESTNGVSRVINNDFYNICMGSNKDNMACTTIDYLNNEEICINNNNDNICLNTSNNQICVNNNAECKTVNFNDEADVYYDTISSYIILNKKQSSFEYIDDIKTNIEDLNMYLNSKINACNSYYSDYHDKKSAYEDEQNKKNTAKFNNGLFIVMQCTPNGWKPLTDSSCKQRCGKEKFEDNFDPKNINKFENVSMFVSKMRHSTKLTSVVALHQESSSDKSRWANGKFYITCDNGNYESNISRMVVDNYEYFSIGYDKSNKMTGGKAYTACDNTYVSTYPQWNQTRSRNDLTSSNFKQYATNGKECKTGEAAMEGWSSTNAHIGCYYCRGGITQIGFTSYVHTDEDTWRGQAYHK